MLFPELKDHRRSVFVTLLSVSLLLLLYVIVRAVVVPFTTDESFSYNVYVTKGILFPSTFDYMSANFHFLNTLGMWICLKLFGNAEWSLRLPNIIGFVFYLYFCMRLVMRNRNTWIVLGGFFLLTVHPYLLDLFGVARGYGLSYGMFFGGLWHSIRFGETRGTVKKHLWFSLLFFSLAWMASFVLTYCFLLNIVYLLFVVWRSPEKAARKWRILELAVIITPVTYLVIPMIKGMQKAGAFTWGAVSFPDSFLTLKSEFLYWDGTSSRFFEFASSLMPAIIGLSVLAAVLVFLVTMMRKNRDVAFWYVIFLFGGSITIITLQHFQLGNPFPMGRTQLYLILLLLLSVVLSVEKWGFSYPASSAITVLLTLPFLLVFLLKFNFNRTHDWSFGQDIKKELMIIAEDLKAVHDKELTSNIAADNVEYQNTVYYLERLGLSQIPVGMRYEDIDYPVACYYLVDTVYTAKLKRKATMIRKFPVSGDMVMRDDSLYEAWNK